jgi:CelD/BcsL family acetyltransferase involved in cellulose biosynthesis
MEETLPDRTAALDVEVLGAWPDGAALAGEWNALARASGATIYQTYEWQSLWWRHFGGASGRALHVVLVRDGRTLVGIAPFFLERATVLGRTVRTHLSLLGVGNAFHASRGMFLDDGPSDYLDILALPGYAPAVAERLCAHVRERAVDEIELLNARPGGFVREALLPALAAAGIEHAATAADVCPHLTLAGPVDEYVKSRDASVRRRLSQAAKAAQEKVLFSVETPADDGAAMEALGALMALHQRRWRKLGYPGLFAETAFADFQRAAVRAFLAQGWCRIATASAASAIVAVRLSFAFNGRLHDYLSGFDDDAPAAKRRPGMALLLAQMDGAYAEGIREIDFLRGDEPYKFELTSESAANMNIVIRMRPGSDAAPVQRAVRMRAFASFLLAREWKLLRVQLQERSFPASLYHYAAFRTGRFFRKFFRGSTAEASA